MRPPPWGRIVASRPCPQIATSWNRLFEMLSGAFGPARYHMGRDLAYLSQDGNAVRAHFRDGPVEEGALLIGADGFRSAVRAGLVPEARHAYAGYVAWRGLIPEREAVALLSGVFDSLAFCLPPGEQFLGYPVAGPNNDLRPGRRSWNVVWYRPADEVVDVPRLLTDATGKLHELSVPPPLIAREVVGWMRAAAEHLLPPQLSAVVRLIEQPFLQPIYDLESARMAGGRAALVGDAAFVIRPHVGGGVVKAAEDAAALAAALEAHSDIEKALAAFEAARIGVGRSYVAQARRLGSYLRYTFDSDEERARAAIHADPERVMAETALLDFTR